MTAALAFLREELAAVPGRRRAALRVLVASLLGLACVATFQLPHAHWVVITIFTVSMTDAGASLRKGLQRMVGTALGGGAAILAAAAFTDRPWCMLPAIALGIGASLFLSGTTTAPYTCLLAGLTFGIFTPTETVPGGVVSEVLWRAVAIMLGSVIGTAAQVLVWPVDPAELVRRALASRLRAVEALLRRTDTDERPPDAELAAGTDALLDLVASAEVRHPSRRRLHAARLAVVDAVEQLVVAARWLERVPVTERSPGERAARATLADAVHAIAAAIEPQTPPPPPPAPLVIPDDVTPAMAATLRDVDAALAAVAHAELRLHGVIADPAPVFPAPGFFTPACTLANAPMLQLAVKAGLGAAVCTILVHALHWPGIGTAVVTCVLIAQPTFAAARAKSGLRIAGALLGGGLGLLTIVGAMPWLDSLAGLLVVATGPLALAAWLVVGSARISYAGIQTAMAYAMSALDPLGPSTALTPGRDRVVGICVGIAVMAVIDRVLWPSDAHAATRNALAGALRHLAALAAGVTPAQAAGHAHAAQSALATALRTGADAASEPGAATRTAERAALRVCMGAAQDAFLGALTLAHHPADDAPARALSARLLALASQLDGRVRPAPVPDATRTAAPDAATRAAREAAADVLHRALVTMERSAPAAPSSAPAGRLAPRFG